jgi:hypothetical protein
MSAKTPNVSLHIIFLSFSPPRSLAPLVLSPALLFFSPAPLVVSRRLVAFSIPVVSDPSLSQGSGPCSPQVACSLRSVVPAPPPTYCTGTCQRTGGRTSRYRGTSSPGPYTTHHAEWHIPNPISHTPHPHTTRSSSTRGPHLTHTHTVARDHGRNRNPHCTRGGHGGSRCFLAGIPLQRASGRVPRASPKSQALMHRHCRRRCPTRRTSASASARWPIPPYPSLVLPSRTPVQAGKSRCCMAAARGPNTPQRPRHAARRGAHQPFIIRRYYICWRVACAQAAGRMTGVGQLRVPHAPYGHQNAPITLPLIPHRTVQTSRTRPAPCYPCTSPRRAPYTTIPDVHPRMRKKRMPLL